MERFTLKSKNNKAMNKCRVLLAKYSNRALFFARMVPFSRTYVSLLAGACRQEFFSYLLFSLFGIVIWNSIFIYLGFSVFINLDDISNIYHNYKLLILIILSVSIILLLLWENRSKKR